MAVSRGNSVGIPAPTVLKLIGQELSSISRASETCSLYAPCPIREHRHYNKPDVSVRWLVVIEHMERVAGALLVVDVSVLYAMALTII